MEADGGPTAVAEKRRTVGGTTVATKEMGGIAGVVPDGVVEARVTTAVAESGTTRWRGGGVVHPES